MLYIGKTGLQSELNVVSESTANNRVGAWDGWRGTAILLVLCGHYYDIKWLWEDRMGVDLFFVLSGTLISKILFEQRMSLKDFYIRRVSRIYPALVVYTITVFAISWLHTTEFHVKEFISSLVFLRTYYPVEPHIWSSTVAIGHFWSLNVEEHAYILLSLVSLVIFKRYAIGWVLLFIGVGFIGVNLHFYNTLDANGFLQHLIRTESAIVFILLSAGYGLLKRKEGWTVPPAVPVLCIVGAISCYSSALPVWMAISISPILLSVAVNHLDNLPKLLGGFLSFTPLQVLGMSSYSIYLWQQLFYEYSWVYPVHSTVVALLAVSVGFISYHLIENPFRKAINAKWSANPSYREPGVRQ